MAVVLDRRASPWILRDEIRRENFLADAAGVIVGRPLPGAAVEQAPVLVATLAVPETLIRCCCRGRSSRSCRCEHRALRAETQRAGRKGRKGGSEGRESPADRRDGRGSPAAATSAARRPASAADDDRAADRVAALADRHDAGIDVDCAPHCSGRDRRAAGSCDWRRRKSPGRRRRGS